jgi:uncharacterized protein YecE (DUF72 family)
VSIRVGTSGWQYADWRGPFYPQKLPQREWLSAYAQTFDTVEVNATFYRLPAVTAVAGWAQTVPREFLMAVKASRYLSHVKRLREPTEPVSRFLDRTRPLRDAGILGPVLLQLPPAFPVAADRLAETLREFGRGLRIAVELRDPSWFIPEVKEVLEAHDAALVWADRGGKSVGPLWETAAWRYLRLHHGRTGWKYDRRDLKRWAVRMNEVADGYIYANNDPGAAAIEDALEIRELIGG